MDVDCSNPRKPTRYSANIKLKSGFTQRFAVPIIALSSLLVSVNGLMLRSIESASDWQIVFGRQLCFTPVMLLLLWIRYRGQMINLFRQLGWDRRWHFLRAREYHNYPSDEPHHDC